MVDGLNACSEEDSGKEMVRRFCDMCNQSGFAENFDALTGKALCDSAFTWKTRVFLILAHEYLLD